VEDSRSRPSGLAGPVAQISIEWSDFQGTENVITRGKGKWRTREPNRGSLNKEKVRETEQKKRKGRNEGRKRGVGVKGNGRKAG
jgi:hypothetical protein